MTSTDSPTGGAWIRSRIREVRDFPEPGIVFQDITPVLADAAGIGRITSALHSVVRDLVFDQVLAIEARGFILGAPLALAAGTGFVPARKPGKLPSETTGVDYALEYGTDRLEIHADVLTGASGVLVIDDVLATGGTAAAAIELVRRADAPIAGVGVLLEIDGLGGRARLEATGLDPTLIRSVIRI